MAARLQAVNQGEPPVLLRIDFDSGHGVGSTRDQILHQYADIYAFLFSRLT
jgi:prolyl oligopeptidase